MNGLLIQWGTVTNTNGSSTWLTNNLHIAYTNTDYKIFLQGRLTESTYLTPVIRTINVNYQSFEYYWGENTNYLNYYTIGY